MQGSLIAGIAILALCTYALRMSGTLLGAKRKFSEDTEEILGVGTTTLLVAVAVTASLFDGNSVGGWARALGVLAALVATIFRMPIISVVVTAAAVTAGLRLSGMS